VRREEAPTARLRREQKAMTPTGMTDEQLAIEVAAAMLATKRLQDELLAATANLQTLIDEVARRNALPGKKES
jgi:hypothetical protein